MRTGDANWCYNCEFNLPTLRWLFWADSMKQELRESSRIRSTNVRQVALSLGRSKLLGRIALAVTLAAVLGCPANRSTDAVALRKN